MKWAKILRIPVGHGLSPIPMAVLAIGFCVAVAGLLTLSYQSLRSGRASSKDLAERRAEVILGLLTSALDRDMKAVQVAVLRPFRPQDPAVQAPDDLRDRFSRAFARFPYPESFFVWTRIPGRDARFYFFNRVERPPAWGAGLAGSVSYPAAPVQYPSKGHPLLDALMKEQAVGNPRYVAFDSVLNGTPYHVVAKVLSEHSGEAVSIIGFTVNLHWVRDHYFKEISDAVLRIRDATQSASISIADQDGRTIASAGSVRSRGAILRRQFSPLFFDPDTLSLAPMGVTSPSWTAQVEADDGVIHGGPTLGTANTYLIFATLAIASLVGMFLTAREVRARADLAELHSEFISTVTHELKTPLASIRLMGETLGNGQYGSLDAIRDYARLLSQEAWRLTRLIDNLLAYARESGARRYGFEPHEVAELVEDVIARFHPQLVDQKFDVTIDIPPDLPRIRGDRSMLLNAIENVVDNAIKYSNTHRAVTIRGWPENGSLNLEVSDLGNGIPHDELPSVFEKFYRGRGVKSGGSGLGLAIVKRVVEDHRGTVHISSVPSTGTVVRLVFPAEPADA